ncbi:MAG: carbohydrate binding family 9 domain-containing protein [Candidatus Latescibacteria bacterium]|nr:carbohydrate binding family 9 domain-containing protein [Candidatus Latescibacterota bacterium]
MHPRKTLLILVILALHLAPARGDEPLVLPRLGGPVQLDGPSDEAAWQAIPPLPLVMNSPTFGGPPSERTEIRIAWDGEYLYAAGRFYHADPAGAQVNSLFRDEDIWRDDAFALVLDTFDDDQTAAAFLTTPAGVRKDFSVYNDAEPSWETPYDMSWNTFWEAATRRTAEGWFAEMRIPVASLRFEVREGRAVMGLITWRYLAGKNEIDVYPEISPKWYWGVIKPSAARQVVLEGVEARRPFYLAPFASLGVGQEAELAGGGYHTARTLKHELGADLKFPLASNLTLDLTANTDFAQVEADDEEVNVTRFSLFFPEKRPFFLERASTFEFRLAGDEQVFYSRRVGLAEEGPVRILGGTRLVGQAAGWDLGFFDLQTAAGSSQPAENFAVLRLKRPVFNRHSTAGGILTSRASTAGLDNLTAGLDGVLEMRPDEFATLKWVQTLGERPDLLDDGYLLARWERRTFQGLGHELGLARSGPGYDPGLGFAPRRDYRRADGRLSWGWTPPESSPFQSHLLALRGEAYLPNRGGKLESAALGPSWDFALKTGASGQVTLDLLAEDLAEDFALSDHAGVPSGSYTFWDLNAYYQSPYGSRWRRDLSLAAGRFYDGWHLTAGATPSLSLSRHLEIGPEYQLDLARFADRHQRFRSHLLRLRTRLALDTRLSASALVQYNSAENTVGLNLRLRYNRREGDDFHLVYDQGLNTDRRRLAPARPRTANRTVLLKYTRTYAY